MAKAVTKTTAKKAAGKGKTAAKGAAAKGAAKGAAKKGAVKAASKAGVATGRTKFTDDQAITVKGEHSRREGSRYHGQYEQMKKAKTVGAFVKAGGERSVLNAAVAEGYAAVK